MKYRYFSAGEFACHCGCQSGKANPFLILLLDWIRAKIGKPIIIKSGVRCRRHNERIGGQPNSQHLLDAYGISNAADISCVDMETLFLECTQVFLATGDGRKRGFIHVDMRPDQERRWVY